MNAAKKGKTGNNPSEALKELRKMGDTRDSKDGANFKMFMRRLVGDD